MIVGLLLVCFVCLQVRGQQRTRIAPFPLSTLEMQKRATQYLRLPGEAIMKLAEELYQAGFISYPRTETDVFDPAMDLQVGLGGCYPLSQCGQL